jgi:hypothetical protein
MRWKLLRRRLSVSAPRVIVRSHLPWPLRWLVVANPARPVRCATA